MLSLHYRKKSSNGKILEQLICLSARVTELLLPWSHSGTSKSPSPAGACRRAAGCQVYRNEEERLTKVKEKEVRFVMQSRSERI